MPASDSAVATLTVDLDAIAENYRRLSARLRDAECAAAMKADAYGLGADRVGPALAAAGCRTFFVAHGEEAVTLRTVLPSAMICVLHGADKEDASALAEHDLWPVLSTPVQIELWREIGRRSGGPRPCVIHADTGMNRLGLTPGEIRQLAEDAGALADLDIRFLISHLACADIPEHPMNRAQIEVFAALRALFPGIRASLANSSGIFLGPDAHFDMVRPGVALYGVNPLPGQENPMCEVVRLQAPILQVREIDTPQSVGYGAAFVAPGRRRIATVPVGYADGYPRSLGGRGWAHVGGVRVPIAGRVSMDLITLDVTEASEEAIRVGSPVTLIGGGVDIDALAAAAGTIGYELLTSLGRRYRRVYVGGRAAA